MEALIRKYTNFQKAHQALRRAIAAQQQLHNTIAADSSDLDDLISAGVIQHFEIAYETAWKFLKQYIYDIYNVEVTSPKTTFRACLTHNLLPAETVDELSELADARNMTTHMYDQVLAQEVCNAVIKHYQALGKILEHIHIAPK